MSTTPRYENEMIRYMLTESEKRDLANEMAQKTVDLQQVKDNLKSIKSDYASQIDVIQAGINSAAVRINTGFEMRPIKCQIVPNYIRKIWEYIRVDTGEQVKVKEMTSDDLQREFDED